MKKTNETKKTKPETKKSWKRWLKIDKAFPLILIVFGITGLLASAAISIEKTHILREPVVDLVCDINPIYSCSNVISAKQSEVFGFSNEIMGIAMFSAIITVGVLVLTGSQLHKNIWKTFMLGMVGSMSFVIWFFYQSVYEIGSLCIFCTIVWFSTWAITASVFTWTYDQKVFSYPKSIESIVAYKRKNIVSMWALFILLIAGLILQHFWYYYGTKLGF